MARRWLRLMFLCIVMLIASSCSNESKSQEVVTLKVMYYNEEQFYEQYGHIFMVKYPNYQFDVVELAPYYADGLAPQKFDDIVAKEKPDIVYDFNLDTYSRNGKLLELDPFIDEAPDFEIEQMNEHILKYLRQKGDGKLYALTPTFVGKALYYNKQLFDEYGIPYPEDFMSWPQVLQLAERFPAQNEGKRIYGLYIDTDELIWLIKDIGDAYQLGFTDGERISIGTSSWRELFRLVTDAYKRGALGIVENAAQARVSIGDNPFSQGTAAMTVDYSYQLQSFADTKFDWDLVTVPTNPATPYESISIYPSGLFGIYAESAQAAKAWQFIQFIHSEAYASAMLKGGISGALPTLSHHTMELSADAEKSIHIDAFYKIAPLDVDEPPMPPSFLSTFMTLGEQAVQAVITEQKTVDEALFDLQQEGQVVLDQARKEAFP